jgi:hypothetical protein
MQLATFVLGIIYLAGGAVAGAFTHDATMNPISHRRTFVNQSSAPLVQIAAPVVHT